MEAWRGLYTWHGDKLRFFCSANLYLKLSDFRVISTEGGNPALCAEYQRFLTLANITLLAPIRNDKAVTWQ